MLKKTVFSFVLAISMTFCLSSESSAALKSAKDAANISPSMAYNPKEAAGDIRLPMPNNLFCILRPVAIPAHGALYDKKFPMGLAQVNESRNFYESRVDGHVAAPLRQADMPAEWRKNLPSDEANDYFYFFIGKYEISNAQWYAVMGENMPEGMRPDLPKADISWYDMQAFLHKYNTWLMENHPDALPAIDKSKAFLRLPTEEEWEFAARGGNRPPEKMNFEDFPLDQDKRIEDFAVFRKDQPMPIGSKNPNPLGIHDMGGNVAELVQSNFQFTIADATANGVVRRMHGAHGGILSKGGSFLSSSEEDMFPGKRVELPMFASNKEGKNFPYATRSLGMRLLLTGINVASAKRAKMLEDEYTAMSGVIERKPEVKENPVKKEPEKKEPEASPKEKEKTAKQDQLVQLNLNGNSLQELDKIINAAASPFMKSNLYQLRDMLKDQNAALEREKEAATLSAIRSAIYKAQAIRNMVFRCWSVAADIDRMEASKKYGNMKEAQRTENANREIASAISSGASLLKLLNLSLNNYKVSIDEISVLPLDYINKKIVVLRKEYQGNDQISKLLLDILNKFEQHIKIVKNKNINSLTDANLLSGLSTERHLKGYITLKELVAKKK